MQYLSLVESEPARLLHHHRVRPPDARRDQDRHLRSGKCAKNYSVYNFGNKRALIALGLYFPIKERFRKWESARALCSMLAPTSGQLLTQSDGRNNFVLYRKLERAVKTM